MEKRKAVGLTVGGLAVAFAITVGTIFLYKNLSHVQQIVLYVIQDVSYVLMGLSTVVFMKLSGKSLREFGLFKSNIGKQVASALIIAAAYMAFAVLTGQRLALKEHYLFIGFQQIFVAFSEELLFRGFALSMFKELFSYGKDVFAVNRRAVFLSALLFGLWHYPWGQSIGQVISAFIGGLIFGSLRNAYEDTDWEIGIPSLACVHWVMNTIL